MDSMDNIHGASNLDLVTQASNPVIRENINYNQEVNGPNYLTVGNKVSYALPRSSTRHRSRSPQILNTNDSVQNFEVYYPHGNITVISKKHNIELTKNIVARQLAKNSNLPVNSTILKSIDILSKGSVFGAMRKSSDSLPYSHHSGTHHRKDSEYISSNRGNSGISSSHLASSSEQRLPISSQEAQRKRSRFRDVGLSSNNGSSFFLTPDKLNDSSIQSRNSLIAHPIYSREDGEDTSSHVRRPSRFGMLSTQQLGMASSQNLALDTRRPSHSSFVRVREDDQSVSNPYVSGHIEATGSESVNTLYPQKKEEVSSVASWKERRRSHSPSKGSSSDLIQPSRTSELMPSPRFRKTSDDHSKDAKPDKRARSELGADDSRLTFNQDHHAKATSELSSTSHPISNKKHVMKALRAALVQATRLEDIGRFEKSVRRQTTNKRSRVPRAQNQRKEHSSASPENRVQGFVKEHGFTTVLHDLVELLCNNQKPVLK